MRLWICDHAGMKHCSPGECEGHLAELHENCECNVASCSDYDGRVLYRTTRCVPVDSPRGRSAVARMKQRKEVSK